MSRPQVNKLGDISIESVDELSREDLRDWVRERLHGQDAGTPVDRDGMPHYLLTLIYPRLNRSVREDLQNIVIEFVASLARAGPSDWSGEAGDELLMLVESVLGQSPRRDDAVDLLLDAVNSRRLLNNLQPDLHHRCLQILVQLRHRAERSFWEEQFQFGGAVYMPTVLEGLALINTSVALEWTASIPWTQATEDAIVGLLPSLLEDYGAARVQVLLEGVLPRLAAPGQEALRRFCKEEDLVLHEKSLIELLSPGYVKHNPDPWETFFDTHRVGNVVTGKVVSLVSFGAFVEIQDGIEGLCHVSELSDERIEKPGTAVEIGQVLPFRVLKLDPANRKIGLSARAVSKEDDPEDSRTYHKTGVGMVPLADRANLLGASSETKKSDH